MAILRAVWLKQLYDSQDPTWDFATIAHWNSVEINIAIVCACLMTLKPFIAKIFPNLFLSVGDYQRHNGEIHPRTIGAASFKTKALSKPKNAHLADGSTDPTSTRSSDHTFRMEDLGSRENDTSAFNVQKKAKLNR